VAYASSDLQYLFVYFFIIIFNLRHQREKLEKKSLFVSYLFLLAAPKLSLRIENHRHFERL